MTAGRTVNSQSVNWCTPPKYVDAVRKVFGGKIALDPCSSEWSIVHAELEYRLPEHDGLRESWDYPTIYVNPPYGADKERRTTIKHWLYKCAYAHRHHGSEVLALVPVTGRNTCGAGQLQSAFFTTLGSGFLLRERTRAREPPCHVR